MKYYVIYDDYTEYNQFEGSWDKQFKEFDNLASAKGFINSFREYGDQRDPIGPLVNVTDVRSFKKIDI
jgi:hypothetical protein